MTNLTLNDFTQSSSLKTHDAYINLKSLGKFKITEIHPRNIDTDHLYKGREDSLLIKIEKEFDPFDETTFQEDSKKVFVKKDTIITAKMKFHQAGKSNLNDWLTGNFC